MMPRPGGAGAPLRLELRMAQPAAARFFPLLGEGILVRGRGGASVEEFLQQAAGISPAYLNERVQTVFLDGKALDDCRTASPADGATLALSAAMPGLAGAVLRREGFFAAMRRQISHAAAGQTAADEDIAVTLKLFNLVARDLGPRLFAQGVYIAAAHLAGFVQRQGRWLWAGGAHAAVDGQPVAAEALPEQIRNVRIVWMRITVEEIEGE